jgi:hypothetical protein
VKLAEVFGSAGSLSFSVQDFDVSGEMAYMRGQMAYAGEGAAAAGGSHVQSFVLIALRQRDDVWLIRSLTLIPMAAATSAPAAPPAAAAPAPPAAPASPTGT